MVSKLNEDGSQWVPVLQMEAGRFFHRLVPIDDHRIAILCGTNGKTGKQHSVLVYDLERSKEEKSK